MPSLVINWTTNKGKTEGGTLCPQHTDMVPKDPSLNRVKHRMCCNRPIDYKMLAKFFLDIIAWLYREGANSHILGYRMCHFLGYSVLAGN